MWTKRVLGGAWVLAFVAVGCAPHPIPPKQPEYLRSPARDYVDPPRSASDGATLGAHEQAPDDWLRVAPTNEHAAAGWETRYGRFQYRRELVRSGNGAMVETATCDPPVTQPVRTASEARARAVLYRKWLASQEPSDLAMASSAAVELPIEQPHLLDCNR